MIENTDLGKSYKLCSDRPCGENFCKNLPRIGCVCSKYSVFWWKPYSDYGMFKPEAAPGVIGGVLIAPSPGALPKPPPSPLDPGGAL
jgi:hypothetical protein